MVLESLGFDPDRSGFEILKHVVPPSGGPGEPAPIRPFTLCTHWYTLVHNKKISREKREFTLQASETDRTTARQPLRPVRPPSTEPSDPRLTPVYRRVRRVRRRPPDQLRVPLSG